MVMGARGGGKVREVNRRGGNRERGLSKERRTS
jgi:hypothetical protein